MDLNPEQLKAVTHGDGPLLILAGAGSGKTRVLTRRIAHLIADKEVGPDNILAVTFTNKAAGEMRERVENLTGIPSKAMWISTFHSFCLRILRRYATHLGYPNSFVVFNEANQVALVKGCLKELNISEESVSPPAAVARISRAKDEYVTPAKFEQQASDFWNQRFAQIYNLYQSELVRQNAMDFGDLLTNVLQLFERHPEILGSFQRQFKYILVDEYQDTNHVQYRLIKALGDVHRNIFVVGDEDQSIYRWRGADIRNILEFVDDFCGADVIRLEQNYRSTPTILNAANSVIRNNSGRLGKTLWTDIPNKENVTIAQQVIDIGEAKYVAQEIEKWSGRGLRYDDMAIFYRTNAQSRIFEECFRSNGIPYVIYGGIRFYERMEIRDILSYMQFVLDGANDTALLRIINRPPRGIGKTTIEKIRGFARERGCHLADAIVEVLEGESISKGARKNLSDFMNMIGRLREKLDELTLGKITDLLMASSGYLASYESSSSPDAQDRVENIREFVRATYEFEGVASVSIPQFLDQVALVSDTDDMDLGKGSVPLMTVHLAKGLEFPVVFMVGMEDGLFPHSRSMDDDDELEEERRLCYVGMTRAKEKLYMTYSSRRRLMGREQYNLPSRFIDEIDPEFVEKVGAASARRCRRTEAAPTGYRRAEAAPTDQYASDPDYFDQRPEDERGSGFKVGTQVIHPVFGPGIVRKVEGTGENQKVTVQFDTGQIKTIMVKYAQFRVSTPSLRGSLHFH